MWELQNIFWDNYIKPALRGVDLSDLQDLHVITQHVTRHLERRNVDHLHIWVFEREDPAQLRILSLQELLHRDAFQFFNRQRADMHFNPSARFDARPLLLEFIHHLFPDKQGLVGQFFNSIFCLLLEHVKSEAALDDGRLFHKEPQVLVCFSRFVHPEVLLDASGCQDWTFWSLEDPCRNFDYFLYFFFVSDTVEHCLFAWFLEVVFAKLS